MTTAPARCDISDWIDAPNLKPAGREFVVGDVHGQANKLRAVLSAMGEAAWRAGEGHLTLLGDLIDRGPDHIGAIKLATRPVEKMGFTGKTLIMGNHDLFLALWLLDYDSNGPSFSQIKLIQCWYQNGAQEIADQAGGMDKLADRLGEEIGAEGMSELKGMVGSRLSGNVRLVHGGPGWRSGVKAAEWYSEPVLFTRFLHGDENHYTWARFWWTRPALDDEIIVHGHTPERMIRRGDWTPEMHRLDGVRLGLDGGTPADADRRVVGAEIEVGRYRVYWSD